jgi:DNA repair exonuclease SbcCD ATPase subunit
MDHETNINASAHQLAVAIGEAERTSATLATAQERVGQIEQRIQEKAAQRAAIVARRAAGNPQPGDGAELELIQADVEGLRTLLSDAEAGVVIVKGPAEEARRQVDFARQALAQAEAQATEYRLIEHLKRLDALMLESANQLVDVGKQIGRPIPPWGPSPQLAHALTKIRAARREL